MVGEYAQEVRTARWVWEGVLSALGRRRFDVDLFTSAPTVDNVRSKRSIVWPDEDALDDAPWVGGGGEALWGNPPFESPTLGEALAKAAAHSWDRDELVMMCPLRPHRRYWPPAWSADLEVHLPAHAFEGEANTFPLPLCLLYFGFQAWKVKPGMAKLGMVVRDRRLTRL